MAFYRALGLVLPQDPDGHVEATLPGELRVMFDTEDVIRSFDATWEQTTTPGRITLDFQVSQPAELGATVADVRAAGHPVKLEPFDAFWERRYATVMDQTASCRHLRSACNGIRRGRHSQATPADGR